MKRLFIFALLLATAHLHAGFLNKGTMRSNHVNLTVNGVLENNGKLIGAESVTLNCDLFSGKGLVQGPIINIRTKTFAYRGTIKCSEKCVIISSHPIKPGTFKKRGRGEFIYLIEEEPTQDEPSILPATEGEYLLTDDFVSFPG